MVHFKCDLCGKDLTAVSDSRFVVRIDAYPGGDPDRITDEDLEADHMEEIAELLRRDESLDDEHAARTRTFRFDLCPCCMKKYADDPLGRELIRVGDFSDFSKN